MNTNSLIALAIATILGILSIPLLDKLYLLI